MLSFAPLVRRMRDGIEAPIRDDLSADPYLGYLLVLAVVTCGFGVWFRLPNFAAPDEYSRLIQPMKVAGQFVADPSFESIRRGITDGRALGATFYLYAITLGPVFLLVVASGQLGEFAALGTIESRWDLWHAAPAWFWTVSLLLARLVSVALGVGCVYLTYRLGTELRDRFAGRLSALLLALSVGFLGQTHVVGEDLAMLFLVLLTTVLAHRYVQSGSRGTFLWGALTGGLAIAFKLSGGVAAVVLGTALVLRAVRSDDPLAELLRPGVVLGGMAVGIVAIYVGIPSVLVGGPMELLNRAGGSISSKTGRTGGFSAPIWYWFTYQFVSGLGAPLFLGVLAGFTATVWRVIGRRDEATHPLSWLLLVALIVPLAVYSRWEFVRLRHLVPTFPPLLVFLGVTVSRCLQHDNTRVRQGLRVALGVVLLTTVLSAGAAEYQYLTDPRDQATRWLETNTDGRASVEVYENSIADVGTPHGRETMHYSFPEDEATNISNLILNESGYTAWMLDMPERQPDYIQLTDGELAYADPGATDYHQYPERRAYVQDLLNGEYDYRVVARFGDTSVGDRTSKFERLFEAALWPDVEGRANGVVLLEHLDQSGSRAAHR